MLILYDCLLERENNLSFWAMCLGILPRKFFQMLLFVLGGRKSTFQRKALGGSTTKEIIRRLEQRIDSF